MKDGTPQDILAGFPARRILIIGDVMLDEYVWGEVRRISPEAPVPVVEIRQRSYVPGGAANTAANVMSLGGRALLGGVVGRDHAAEKLIEALQQHGVETEGLVIDDTRPTTIKTRIVAHNQQLVRVDYEHQQPLAAHLEDMLLGWVERRVHDVDAFIISDYAKGVVSNQVAERVIQIARETGKALVVDPKGVNYSKYRGATVITPNIHEVEIALNREIKGDTDLEQTSRQLSSILEGSALLITRGPDGMSLFLDSAEAVHIPAAARSVFDVTGAGDTVVSALALALAAGATLEEAAYLANRAAGIVVGKLGTATVSAHELLTERT